MYTKLHVCYPAILHNSDSSNLVGLLIWPSMHQSLAWMDYSTCTCTQKKIMFSIKSLSLSWNEDIVKWTLQILGEKRGRLGLGAKCYYTTLHVTGKNSAKRKSLFNRTAPKGRTEMKSLFQHNRTEQKSNSNWMEIKWYLNSNQTETQWEFAFHCTSCKLENVLSPIIYTFSHILIHPLLTHTSSHSLICIHAYMHTQTHRHRRTDTDTDTHRHTDTQTHTHTTE